MTKRQIKPALLGGTFRIPVTGPAVFAAHEGWGVEPMAPIVAATYSEAGRLLVRTAEGREFYTVFSGATGVAMSRRLREHAGFSQAGTWVTVSFPE